MLEILVLLFLIIAVGWAVTKLTLAIIKWLALNTIAGLLILGLLNFLGITHVQLNLLNLLIVAIGGIPGVFIVILLSLL
ncbi:pro-sigmaK processing inhibitor BofA family protein [Thermococcus sp. JCM 11816]|uniref:pro-sigmaK processing inhibitor BofA family protein n=1 Tax=Thermococcus sp. (strain JCM 11816 / KS-1) TaxID=1295125 RepID=UPI0006D15B3B